LPRVTRSPPSTLTATGSTRRREKKEEIKREREREREKEGEREGEKERARKRKTTELISSELPSEGISVQVSS